MKKLTKYLKHLTRTRIVSFWGSRYRITPILVDKIFGDGEKVIHLTPLATRPNYYIIRVDSKWDCDNSGEEAICDHLEELYEAIEEEYGTHIDTWYHENGRTYTKHWPFPALNADCGASWGKMKSKGELNNQSKKLKKGKEGLK